jgi:hypothetical protein
MSERGSAREAERYFRPDGGPADDGTVYDLSAGRVSALPVAIDYAKLTNEGKLQIVLTGEAIRGEDLAKVRDLLTVMTGRVLVDFVPEQGALPL